MSFLLEGDLRYRRWKGPILISKWGWDCPWSARASIFGYCYWFRADAWCIYELVRYTHILIKLSLLCIYIFALWIYFPYVYQLMYLCMNCLHLHPSLHNVLFWIEVMTYTQFSSFVCCWAVRYHSLLCYVWCARYGYLTIRYYSLSLPYE